MAAVDSIRAQIGRLEQTIQQARVLNVEEEKVAMLEILLKESQEKLIQAEQQKMDDPSLANGTSAPADDGSAEQVEREDLENVLASKEKLTPQQAKQLAAQVFAYKQIARGQIVPDNLSIDALRSSTSTVPTTTVNTPKSVNPPPKSIPLPPGVDPNKVLALRDARVQARLATRMQELESMPSTLPPEVKTRALIELRALHLIDMQKKLRAELLGTFRHETVLETSLDRRLYRRCKSNIIRTQNITDQLEKEQRLALEKRRAAKHKDYMNTILQHRDRFMEFHLKIRSECRATADRARQEVRKREENKRKREDFAERARMQALMEDNEEEYRKLVKEKKDSRLNMLLEKTDSYVNSFSELVAKRRKAQKEKDATDAAAAAIELGADPGEEQAKIQSMLNSDEDAEQLNYYELAHSIGEQIMEQPKTLVGGQLKPYQMLGLEWMVSLHNNSLNGILADEMGLGKTIQSIALVSYLVEVKKISGHFLVVVPLSTMSNWSLEFVKWAPAIGVIAFKGSPKERQNLGNQIRLGQFNVLLTTYEYVMREKSLLGRVNWQYLIVDEGHRIRNHESKLTQILSQHYRFPHRLLLTGTPLQNNLPELWGLMNFLLPDIFKSAETFEEWFSQPFANTGESAALNTEEKMLVIRSLHKVLRPFLLRRMKSEVESQLPQKTEFIVRLPLTPLQRAVYNQIRENNRIMGEGAKAKSVNNTMMHLRKVCNHPYLFPEVEQAFNISGGQYGDHLFRSCAKFELLDRLLPKLQKTGHRVLLFTTMTALLNVMEDYLRWKQIKYLRLDGGTKAEDRGEMLTAFNDPNSEYFIFLLSTRAGGLGLNLQTADTVIIYDSDWNPFQDMQAQDRAHRIGQKSEVKVIRLVTMGKDSIEEYVLEAAERKRNMDAKVIQAGRFDQKTTADERRRILEELLAKDEDKSEEQDEPDTWEEINEMIARTKDEFHMFQDYDEQIIKEWGSMAARYVSEEDVPHIYLESAIEEQDRAARMEPVVLGRGRRERKDIVYTEDLITENQWVKAVDEGNLDEAIEKRVQRKRKRGEERPRTEDSSAVQSEKEDERDDEAEQPPTPEASSGKRRRQPKKKTPSAKKKPAPSAENSDEELTVDNESETPATVGPARKRRRVEATPKAATRDGDSGDKGGKLAAQMLDIWQAMRDKEDEETEDVISELFLNKPSKRDYPDYYQVIDNPIAMADIKRKIQKNQYATMDEFEADVDLMVMNCATYNDEESDIVKWAYDLKAVFTSEKQKLSEASDSQPATGKSTPTKTPAKSARTPKRKKATPVKDDQTMDVEVDVDALPSDEDANPAPAIS